MRSERPHPQLAPLGIACLPLVAISLSLALLAPPGRASAAEKVNSCEDCHNNADFLVTNKQLYDYYQEWSRSIHSQEEVSCDDCHGGNAEASDKDEAHGDGVKSSDPSSGIYYKNVPETCGTCHEEVLEGFVTSNHFKHLEKKKDDEQGPTCVTCHGSIDSEVLNVTTVAKACARCHNPETDNHPEHPERAEAILNRFLSIHRFYRYITIRAEPEEARAFFEFIDPRMKRLSVTWHTFDLEKIDEGTTEVLMLLKMKRDEIRSRRAAAKAK
jgi:nitrate/TMAO reductase-like tetraheme cytochrome c subunit